MCAVIVVVVVMMMMMMMMVMVVVVVVVVVMAALVVAEQKQINLNRIKPHYAACKHVCRSRDSRKHQLVAAARQQHSRDKLNRLAPLVVLR
jgi:biopolymer transport protein ExbB/TolQ